MNRQELIEAIDGLEVFDMSYCNGDMKHLPRKNFYINKYKALSLIDKLDDIPEVLSLGQGELLVEVVNKEDFEKE